MPLRNELRAVNTELLRDVAASTYEMNTKRSKTRAVMRGIGGEYPALESFWGVARDTSADYSPDNFVSKVCYQLGAGFVVLSLRNYAEVEKYRESLTGLSRRDGHSLKDELFDLRPGIMRSAAEATYDKGLFTAEADMAWEGLTEDYPGLNALVDSADEVVKDFSRGNYRRENGFCDGASFALMTLRNYAEGELLRRPMVPAAS